MNMRVPAQRRQNGTQQQQQQPVYVQQQPVYQQANMMQHQALAMQQMQPMAQPVMGNMAMVRPMMQQHEQQQKKNQYMVNQNHQFAGSSTGAPMGYNF